MKLVFLSLILLSATTFADEDLEKVEVKEVSSYSMSRDASGTAWQPDSSPMPMLMAELFPGWHFMLHANVFAGLAGTTSTRGRYQFMSTNWLMGSAQGYVGPGRLSAKAMFSLEALTVGGAGYPLLLQSGESWQGVRLHDNQHPHNLFMETSIRYQLPLNDNLNLDFYVAPVGEPTLGPVAFVHRVSARSNPLAPLGHHWMDSSHISFGVLSAGIFGGNWKVEGSWFNGREPSENRYAFDLNVPDSYAIRMIYNPIEELSFQASYGYLNEPERLEPEVGVYRVTNSVSSNIPFGDEGNFSAILVFGMNLPTEGSATAFGLAEFDLAITKSHTIYGRAEGGTKSGLDLVLLPPVWPKSFGMGAFSLGYAYEFPKIWWFAPSVGGVGTIDLVGKELSAYYGGKIQGGGMVYLKCSL